jgi:small subunit ribosomal protein S9
MSETQKVTSSKKSETNKKNKKVVSATGRRKGAIARVQVISGSGEWQINGKTLQEYFPNKVHQQIVNTPFVISDNAKKFDVIVRVGGGGTSGQAGAVKLGVARSLNDLDREVNRPLLKKAGLLTRDSRIVERKKAGLKKARKASQFSKR